MPQNGINHPGVTALAQAFAINPLLRIINLNDNTFTEKGGVAMAEVRRGVRPHGPLEARGQAWLSPTFPSFHDEYPHPFSFAQIRVGCYKVLAA